MPEGTHRTGMIILVEDDAGLRELMGDWLRGDGYGVASFGNGGSFLESLGTDTPACVVLDLNIPERSGMEILEVLDAPHYPAPIIVISGQCDVPTAVKVMKRGAADLLEKPFSRHVLLARIQAAMEEWHRRRAEKLGSLPKPFTHHERLTAREETVLNEILSGSTSREVGNKLGLSVRTIEFHRNRIMQKFAAKNTADLVRIVLGDGMSDRRAR